MKKKVMISVLALSLTVGTGLFLWAINKTDTKKTNEHQFVEIAPNEKVYINGTIDSKEESTVYLETEYSNIVKVYVKDKASVKKGASLFRCQNDTVTSQINEYKDQVAVYETEVDNNSEDIKTLNSKISDRNSEIRKLNKSSKDDETKKPENDIKVQQYESEIETYKDQIASYNRQSASTKTNIKNVNAKIKELEKKEYKEVKASIAGTVYISDNKQDVTKPYMTIYSTQFVVNGSTDEKSREQLNKDDAVDIKVVATSMEIGGVISSIGDMPLPAEATDSASALSKYEVIITLANQVGLVNGYHVQAVYEVPQVTIPIPKSALIEEDNQGYVYKETNGQITKWRIIYEESDKEGYVEVSSGIESTDKVILDAQEYLKGTE